MNLIPRKPPWYVAGLAFECVQCGRCCAGPEEGYVWVTDVEISEIARRLGITATETRRQYVRKACHRMTIVEDAVSRDCIFLKPRPCGGKGCSIYPVRPAQCRTWPFWPINLSSPDAWARSSVRCGGMNRGRLHAVEEIEAARNATH